MVYIPLLSSLGKRKGGGKGGGGKSSSGGTKSSSGSSSSSSGTHSSGTSSSGSSSGSSSSGSSTGTKSSSSNGPTISSSGSSKRTSTYGSGDSRVTTIPAGQMFSGRQTGGGTRTIVYGTPFYGSGYPVSYYPGGTYHHGVVGRGFPFFFWPIVWGTTAGLGAGYIWAALADYGTPNNGSRPGGPEMQMRIESPNAAQVYHIIADRDTVTALVNPLQSSCANINNKPIQAVPFDGGDGQPKPEMAIQYYRASSVALTLNGYNNSAVFTDDESLPASPLPSGIDQSFLNCLNTTIGAAVPLVDAALSLHAQQHAFWMACVAVLVTVRNAW